MNARNDNRNTPNRRQADSDSDTNTNPKVARLVQRVVWAIAPAFATGIVGLVGWMATTLDNMRVDVADFSAHKQYQSKQLDRQSVQLTRIESRVVGNTDEIGALNKRCTATEYQAADLKRRCSEARRAAGLRDDD